MVLMQQLYNYCINTGMRNSKDICDVEERAASGGMHDTQLPTTAGYIIFNSKRHSQRSLARRSQPPVD